jgi:hypothetical protein
VPQRVLEEEPEDPGRNRADDEEPAELRVGVVLGDPAVAERPAEAAQDPDPVAPEEPEQDDRGREVRGDEENESFWRMCQPRSFGATTLWPRLEIGKSSEKPCSRPRTIACP